MSDFDIQKSKAKGEAKPPAESATPSTVIEAKPVPLPRPDTPPEVLELRNRLMIRSWLARHLVKVSPYYGAGGMALLLLQGFRPLGFHLDTPILAAVIGAVIVTHGVLLKVFGREVWRRKA
jgi:hypothetical protein